MREFTDLVEEDYSLQLDLENFSEEEIIDVILQFLKIIREAGSYIADFEQRDWLAHSARKWGKLLYDKTGDFYSVALFPYRNSGRVYKRLLWVKNDNSEWQNADVIPVYYLKTGDEIITSDIEWLISQVRGEKDSHYVFVIFQDNLTEKAFKRLVEFNEHGNTVIIPIHFSVVTEAFREPGSAYRKLVELKKLSERTSALPAVHSKLQKLPVVTDDQIPEPIIRR